MEAARTIAVVDDDASCRDSVVGLVRSAGFTVFGFASAEDFLRSDQLRASDCLILDVRMPGMSGLALQGDLRTRRPELPIVFITAHCDDATRARVLRDGAVDCLPKPFEGEALLNAIRTAFGSRGEPA
jgi:FixJ family two-component response regulator